LILLMTLAKGCSRMLCGSITLHTQTAIHIARLLTTANFSLEPVESDQVKGTSMLVCEGIGHRNPYLETSS
ncbi:RNA 3'-terminal phosphate cyclase, partial [Plakobranchus ocellatus]